MSSCAGVDRFSPNVFNMLIQYVFNTFTFMCKFKCASDFFLAIDEQLTSIKARYAFIFFCADQARQI